MITGNMYFSVIAALWDITINKNLNGFADKDDCEKYSKGLNLGSPYAKGTPYNLKGREKTLEKVKQILCL